MPAKPIVVAGVVRGPGGEQLPQARVFIARGPVPVPDVAALTDAEGRFTLSLPAAGSYELACVAEGYAILSTTVEVADEQRLRLELRLAPDRPGQ
jgi:Carboxypeptidase regulatory-like domain